MSKQTKERLHNISLAWLTVSILVFFGIEGAITAGAWDLTALLAINLAASFAVSAATLQEPPKNGWLETEKRQDEA